MKSILILFDRARITRYRLLGTVLIALSINSFTSIASASDSSTESSFQAHRFNIADDPAFPRTIPKTPEFEVTATGVKLVLCYNWGCATTLEYLWNRHHLEKMSSAIQRCSSDAENELLAIRNAVRETEREILRKVPILNGDVAGNLLDQYNPGRLDCIDNASNTDAILAILQHHRPFAYWKVHETQRDGFFKPHRSAAVITHDPTFLEKYRKRTKMGATDSSIWVIDTWLTTFAHQPFLYELNDWKFHLDPWGNELYYGLYNKEPACWR